MVLTSEGVLPPPKTALVPLATAPAPLLTVDKSPKSFAFPNVLTEKNASGRALRRHPEAARAKAG